MILSLAPRSGVNIVKCAVLMLVAQSVFAFSMNPISDFASTDSAVFAYIGKGMTNGLIPYRDIFDHKGPLLYFINWLGCLLGIGYQGVWLVEVSLFLCSGIFAFQLLSRILRGVGLWLCTIAYLHIFFALAAGGNLTETYAVYATLMFWAMFSLDVFYSKLRFVSCIGAGVVAGIILMLRPNMLGFCVPVAIILITDWLRTHDFYCFVVRISSIMVGVLIVVLPIVAWLWVNDAVSDMWNCYIIFNVDYASTLPVVVDKWILLLAGAITLNVCACVWTKGPLQRLMLYNFSYLVAASFFIIVKLRYAHYYLPILPAIIVPLTWGLNLGVRSRIRWLLFATVLFIALRFLIYYPFGTVFDLAAIKDAIIHQNFSRGLSLVRSPESTEILAFKNYIDTEDSVLVIGNACEIYYRLGVYSKSRYFYQSVARFSQEIHNDVENAIKLQCDDYIIVCKTYLNPWEILLQENYAIIATTQNYLLWKVKRTTKV